MTIDPETNESKPYLKDRPTLGHFTAKKVDAGELHTYQREWNTRSLDGLPSLRSALKDSGHSDWWVGLETCLSRHWDKVETVKSLVLILFAGLIVFRWL